MDIYKMQAIKTTIMDFASLQFLQNGISPEAGALIMDGVNSYFQRTALENLIRGMIQKPEEKTDGTDDNTEP